MGTGSNATKTTGGGHGQYFSWHQDSTYSGFSGDDAVTFWIAFCPVTEEMGPLQYRVGSHALGQLRHEERPEERNAGNMLAFGQTIPPTGECPNGMLKLSLNVGQCCIIHITYVYLD